MRYKDSIPAKAVNTWLTNRQDLKKKYFTFLLDYFV